MKPNTRNAHRPLLIGLTGGIASGKSAVAERFAQLGVDVVDTDALAREVVAPGSDGLAALVAAFGAGILGEGGGLDRARMRARVFDDEAARRRLETILHPRIEALAMQRAHASRAPYVVLVIPLLVESGWDTMVDRVLVVDAPEAVQVRRLVARDGGDDAQARAILAAQAPRDRRLAVADDVIDNRGPATELDAHVARLHQKYLELADAARPG